MNNKKDIEKFSNNITEAIDVLEDVTKQIIKACLESEKFKLNRKI